jgi:2-oxo-3-hexenedioate decarboxylase
LRDAASLAQVEARLFRGGELIDRGTGANVLGSPLIALQHLVELLARQPAAPALAGGEIVTTGVLTDAHPVAPGETWRTELSGLQGLTLEFT